MGKWKTKQFLAKVEKVTESRLVLVGEYVRSQTSLLTPVITGNLADSYTFVTSKQRGDVKGRARKGNTMTPPGPLTVKNGTNVSYAILVELGRAGKPGRRQLQTALKISKQAILRLLDIQ